MAICDRKEGPSIFPSNIFVFGGGRWSRVVIEVLCGLLPQSARLSVHTPHNAVAMAAWALERGFKQQIDVSSSFPQLPSERSNAVIVANAARDHEEAIEWALSKGIPVLVEKPIALDSSTSQRLADRACRENRYFAAAHVFLFASYIEKFARIIADEDGIQHICVSWVDPQSETRYGESKNYDPGVPIFADLLPHILSILGALTLSRTVVCQNLELTRGGAQLNINLSVDGIACTIQMARNGNSRQRTIDVSTRKKMVSLDFSNEPGLISIGSTTLSGDPDWECGKKPLPKMLEAFLQGAAGGILDNRLDIAIGLRASQLIDQVSSVYSAALSSWLSKRLLMLHDRNDADLYYALSEIIYTEEPHSSISIGKKIDFIYRYISSPAGSSLSICSLNDNPVDYIRIILQHGKSFSYS